MKIGLLTYHHVHNFGANLQALSTYSYLKNNGFDPIFINWIPEDLERKDNSETPGLQASAHIEFIENYLLSTELCRDEKDIIEVISRYKIESIIIGSDAVLRHKTYLSSIELRKTGIIFAMPSRSVIFPSPYWGSFYKMTDQKISMSILSASSQNAPFKFFRGKLRKDMNAALRQFNTITVRDRWTKKMIEYLTRGAVSPDITPDPVFGFNQNVTDQPSEKEIKEKFALPDKYLLLSFRSTYAVSYTWLESMKDLAEKNGLSCVVLTMPGGINFKHPFSLEIPPPLSPIDWYSLIKHSSGYIGENMHPIVVALHNSVPFYAFDSYGIKKFKYFINERSSKIDDLIRIAGFESNKINILKRGFKAPDASIVFQSIMNFDKEKCTKFSEEYYEKYLKVMKLLTITKS